MPSPSKTLAGDHRRGGSERSGPAGRGQGDQRLVQSEPLATGGTVATVAKMTTGPKRLSGDLRKAAFLAVFRRKTMRAQKETFSPTRWYDEALLGHHGMSSFMGHTNCSITCWLMSTCPSCRKPDRSATRSDRTLSG